MRKLCRLPVLPGIGLVLGLLLLSPSNANADLLSNIGLYDGGSAPTVYITYTALERLGRCVC